MLIEIEKGVFIPTDMITRLWEDEPSISIGSYGFNISMIGGEEYYIRPQLDGGVKALKSLFDLLKKELGSRDLKIVKL